MKKLYNNPECKILLLQSEDIMIVSKNEYNDVEAQDANIWTWEY